MRTVPLVASTLRQALDRLLDGGLDGFVTARRAEGVSWRRISVELFEETGVDVTHESLRAWYREVA